MPHHVKKTSEDFEVHLVSGMMDQLQGEELEAGAQSSDNTCQT